MVFLITEELVIGPEESRLEKQFVADRLFVTVTGARSLFAVYSLSFVISRWFSMTL